MATMTIVEAEHIFYILCIALQDTSHRHHPVSALEGYDIYQICTALKLKIANEFLLLTGRGDFDEKFSEAVEYYEAGPGYVISLFVPDDQVDVDAITAKPAFDFQDPRYLSQETMSSFARYCRSVGVESPIYWQMIYTRLGLEYTSSSPKRNEPVIAE